MSTNNTRIPAYLKAGDTIGITCPAGSVQMKDMQYMIQQLEAWGFVVKLGTTVGTNFNKFSATDDERRQDLQNMLDDDSIQAILFGRGGYGAVRIIDGIDFSTFIASPKWLLGYSDITCFHLHINRQLHISTIHAHMNGGYLSSSHDLFSTQSIYDTLTGKPIDYSIPSHSNNRVGECTAELIGGNLALISDLIGTPSEIDTDGKILFIEDIGEYKYNIDRMMWQLVRAGKLSNLKGLIVGGFTNTNDDEIPFGMTEVEIIQEKVKDFTYPVCYDFPVGHQAKNWALKLGIEYTFSVQAKEVTLKENV